MRDGIFTGYTHPLDRNHRPKMSAPIPNTILIADDHPIFRKGLCEVIAADPGFRIVGEATNGEDALGLIRSLRPAVAILDINMPRLNGIGVVRGMTPAEMTHTPTVLLTMHEDGDLFEEAMDAGVGAYVLKESAVEDLLTALRAVLNGDRFVSPRLTHLLLRRREDAAGLRREKPGLDLLTPTERRILKCISEDKTTKEIADLLSISPRTVETHRQNVSNKLHLQGSHSLLRFAFANRALLER